ncbi:hypothetical protein [Rhodococcus ruber]|uniref:hypothetical protein n=1 Tax=Rhodococcus ruber TaxID=1830 RepID=UPI0037844E01
MRFEDLPAATRDYYLTAADLVLAKCNAHDPWFPKPSDAIAEAWAETFARSRLTREDLLAGVARAYSLAGDNGYRPLAGSIVTHAKAAYAEALAALPPDQRERMVELIEILQDMGIAPPDAHRYARRVALRRRPPFELTDTQRTELTRRITERKALAAAPRRALPGALGRMFRPA